MCYIKLETNRHLVGEPDHYPQHPQHHHLLQDGQSTKGDMFLEFLVHTDENVNMYSWKTIMKITDRQWIWYCIFVYTGNINILFSLGNLLNYCGIPVQKMRAVLCYLLSEVISRLWESL
nr:uncharacterized protein LOC105337019 isoform X3 [Crassostrea gigas]